MEAQRGNLVLKRLLKPQISFNWTLKVIFTQYKGCEACPASLTLKSPKEGIYLRPLWTRGSITETIISMYIGTCDYSITIPLIKHTFHKATRQSFTIFTQHFDGLTHLCYTLWTLLLYSPFSTSLPSYNHAGHWGQSMALLLLNFHCTAHWCNRLGRQRRSESERAHAELEHAAVWRQNTIISTPLLSTKLERFQALKYV